MGDFLLRVHFHLKLIELLILGFDLDGIVAGTDIPRFILTVFVGLHLGLLSLLILKKESDVGERFAVLIVHNAHDGGTGELGFCGGRHPTPHRNYGHRKRDRHPHSPWSLAHRMLLFPSRFETIVSRNSGQWLLPRASVACR